MDGKKHSFLYRCMALLLCLILALAQSGCAGRKSGGEESKEREESAAPEAENDGYRLFLEEWHYRFSGAPEALSAEGQSLTLRQGGRYRISGSLTDGRLIVDAPPWETVHLILEGVTITCRTTEPLWIKSAACVILETAPGSVNSLNDCETASGSPSEDPQGNAKFPLAGEPFAACLRCDCRLIVQGSGTLNLSGKRGNSLITGGDLFLEGGVLTLNAVHTAALIHGSLRISGGRLNITSAENGVAAIGYGGWEGNVLVEGGTLAVACRNTAVLYSHRTSLPEKQVSFLCPQPMRKLSPYASPS